MTNLFKGKSKFLKPKAFTQFYNTISLRDSLCQPPHFTGEKTEVYVTFPRTQNRFMAVRIRIKAPNSLLQVLLTHSTVETAFTNYTDKYMMVVVVEVVMVEIEMVVVVEVVEAEVEVEAMWW